MSISIMSAIHRKWFRIRQDAEAMISAGTNRIGTSAGIKTIFKFT